jgi:hypothetical protein
MGSHKKINKKKSAKFRLKRNYKNYSEKSLEEVLQLIRRKRISINAAAKQYGIAKGTLHNKVNNRNENKVGRPMELSAAEVKILVDHVIAVGDWGFPFGLIDLRHLIKSILDKAKRKTRFTNNYPSKKWAYAFLKSQRQLRKRTCRNIKTSKASLSPEIVQDYFNNLNVALKVGEEDEIKPEHIFNYDETNLTDDPGSKISIFRRGIKYPERIRDFSKSSTSIMFCGSAAGELLPPYVVYKSAHLWQTWVEGGPKHTRYNRSDSGWFNCEIFADWFEYMFVPHVKKFKANVALIGDNLSSHFSERVIELARKHNITFICLPTNSTHICQPLDVAFFRPLKGKWRIILDYWKSQAKKNCQTVTKEAFPRLLKQLCESLVDNDKKSNALVSGMKSLKQM